MLTRSDETVIDCLETWDCVRDVGLRHAGFKDIGVDVSTLIELNRRMHERDVITYLEVVSTTPEACLRSARAAVAVGVDRLMGGQEVNRTLQLLQGTGIEYLPFAGLPTGHPTRLGGDAQLVERHCNEFAAMGCSGVDLLAYRATERTAARSREGGSSRHRRLPGRRRQRGDGRADRRSAGRRCRRLHDWFGGVRRFVLAAEGVCRVAAPRCLGRRRLTRRRHLRRRQLPCDSWPNPSP